MRLARGCSTVPAMAHARCPECHASLVVPDEHTATTTRCIYCGATVPLADADARRRHALELEREARLREQQRLDAERDARRDAEAAAERRAERRERRRGRWGARILALVTALAAPLIIAITVFDLPARLGFGPSGADRLAQITRQLREQGCTVLAPVRSTYATSTVSKLVEVEAGCVRVLAAGAGDHRSLGLRLYAADGALLGRAADSLDPQLTYCGAAAGTLRYEIVVGPAAKGRLSHTVLRCPSATRGPAR